MVNRYTLLRSRDEASHAGVPAASGFLTHPALRPAKFPIREPHQAIAGQKRRMFLAGSMRVSVIAAMAGSSARRFFQLY